MRPPSCPFSSRGGELVIAAYVGIFAVALGGQNEADRARQEALQFQPDPGRQIKALAPFYEAKRRSRNPVVKNCAELPRSRQDQLLACLEGMPGAHDPLGHAVKKK